MTKKCLICYTFENITPVKRKQFDRKLFGTTEKTHNGKYITTTKGYLTDKKYRKPVKSTILIEQKYEKDTLKILTKFSAKYEVFKLQT